MRSNRDDQRQVVGVLGSGGMANGCELLLNVVKMNKPKTLTGLNQNGAWDGLWVSSFPQRSYKFPPANRQSLTHPRGRVHGTW